MLAMILLSVAAAAPAVNVSDLVVRIENRQARYDWNNPWSLKPVETGFGSGFLIAGDRILTNAHVVSDARQLTVKRSDSAEPVIAIVEVIGHDCDLAVLRVSKKDFFKGLKPLELGDVPEARSQVTTYGYPVGGQELSSTAGIVSRVEDKLYLHTRSDSHVAVQTDAAINPGNSGGPVIKAGKVVGVAFQGLRSQDNIGFFIPTPVIRHFLDDAKDGKYDGYPDSGFHWLSLTSPALRKERGLPEGRTGVVVQEIIRGGTGEGLLEEGDVITSIEGVPVADDGRIAVESHRLQFLHLMDMKQVGAPLRMTVWRGGKELSLQGPARRIARRERDRISYDQKPRYVLYGGLLFMPLDITLLMAMALEWTRDSRRELLWRQYFKGWEEPSTADREVVLLTRVFSHQVNSKISWSPPEIIERVNGREISDLKDLAASLGENKGRFHVFESSSNSIEALDREAADAAQAEILEKYAIPQAQNL